MLHFLLYAVHLCKCALTVGGKTSFKYDLNINSLYNKYIWEGNDVSEFLTENNFPLL